MGVECGEGHQGEECHIGSKERDEKGGLPPEESPLWHFLGLSMGTTSLNYLPVLSEKMSLVGRRSLLMQYFERYTPEEARR